MHCSNVDRTCPVCGTVGTLVTRLDSGFIRTGLGKYFRKAVPPDVTIPDYQLLRCAECSLEFADPMIPGNNEFYSWISSLPEYYPGARWEWPVVIDEIRTSGTALRTVLEIGCGSGSFLSSLRDSLPNVKAVGLDPTMNAIDKCRAAGLEGYAETLQEYAANPMHEQKQFDFLCAFHCLEHVAEPKQLLLGMKRLAHQESCIFFSTPYSPMSFETNWHDPLNHPPHHMTRWNARAYRELASQTGLSVDLIMPPAGNIFRRAFETIRLRIHGPHGGGKALATSVLAGPYAVVREIARQTARERVGGRVASDVVLARFQIAK